MTSLRIVQDGETVHLLSNGALVASMPHDAALAVAKELLAAGKRAEEQANAERIAHDQAIVLRLGLPVGLTRRPDIQAEAAKLAAWDSDLRRYLPGGIKSKGVVGTPAVLRHPTKGDRNGEGL